MGKYAFFAFKGETMCFSHVILNVLELKAAGHEALIVVEGTATKTLKDMDEAKGSLLIKAKEAGIIDCVCKACSRATGAHDYLEANGYRIDGDMGGHPPMARYIDNGFTIITL
jgi:hypothetical protein